MAHFCANGGYDNLGNNLGHGFCKQGIRYTSCTVLVGGNGPQAPYYQSKLCGCGGFLRHPPLWLSPKSKKAPMSEYQIA